MEKSHLSPISESGQSPLTWSDTIFQPPGSPPTSPHSRTARLRQPWRHSISQTESLTASRTIREFKPGNQRWRLFYKSVFQFFITVALCALMAGCLAAFAQLKWMTVHQVKAFNALIVLLSVFLGNNLTSSLREYAMMLRWRILMTHYRSLHEFDLLMHCESLRQVMRLFWVARGRGRVGLNKTQVLCVLWLSLNVMLQILVALLGLTYNLDTSTIPMRRFGKVSVANLTLIRDVWGDPRPTFDAQLGSANSYGIQGQDYLFINNVTIPGQEKVPSWGSPGVPTVYGNEDWSIETYVFQDLNLENPSLSLESQRNISTTATCREHKVLDGGNGTSRFVTFVDDDGRPRTLDVARVGPGAMTYIGVLNSTCGPRCTQIMALQSSNEDTVPTPSFYKCNNTISLVNGIEHYLFPGQTEATFQMPDLQARILAGAIGWSGFNYSEGDQYQYVRYTTESWWSPNSVANADMVGGRVMEFAIEAIAAMDYNGPRVNVTGWYPTPAQIVDIQWKWAGTGLGLIPLLHLIALVCVITWANAAVIRDNSCLSTARLLRPIVAKLGDKGCILSGEEIADELSDLRVKYGWREPAPDFTFHNDIPGQVIRHLDILEESEGHGLQGSMPAGLYDGLSSQGDADADEEPVNETTALLHRRRARRSMSI